MASEQETVANTETSSAGTNGNLEQQNTGSVSDAPKAEETQNTPDTAAELERLRAERDALQKERDQARQRENQLKNQAEEQERKRLEEANEFKSLYEKERQWREDREAREQQAEVEREAKQLRDSLINSYDNEAVKKAALALTNKNPNALMWSGELDESEAQASVKNQLDALAEVLGPQPTVTKAEQENPTISGNNPGGTPAENPDETRIERIKRLEKKLENVVF